MSPVRQGGYSQTKPTNSNTKVNSWWVSLRSARRAGLRRSLAFTVTKSDSVDKAYPPELKLRNLVP